MSAALVLAVAILAGPEANAAASPATPQTIGSPTANSVNQIKVKGDADKVVCKAEQQTGTRLGNVRICMTNAQWAAKSADDQQVLENSQVRGYTFQH